MRAGVQAQVVNGIAEGQQMNGETLFEETDYFRAFPAPSEVFANRVEEHSNFLLPIGTLSLRRLSKQWDGVVHFVMPIEPCCGYGCPGERTDRYHNYLCRPNWIGYRMIGDKCELACDFRFFHKAYYAENPPTNDISKHEALELPGHYLKRRQEFERQAQIFRQDGWQDSLVRCLGGVSLGGNWACDFPLSAYPDQFEEGGNVHNCDRVVPRTEDGRDFHYIGNVEMWNYISDTNGILLLFYDPVDRIVLTTIDWT
jgi:hypothetical protein